MRAPRFSSVLPALPRPVHGRKGPGLKLLGAVASLLLLALPVHAAAPPQPLEADLDAYLAAFQGKTTPTYDEAIPTPKEVLGFEVGEWHLRHDLLVKYMERLAAASDRVQLTVTGETYEQRPLLLLTISSPENLARLDEIQERHRSLSDPKNESAPAVDDLPVVVYMGYSVHGDEPSGSNAAPIVGYHLAAAQDDETRDMLDNAVILLDPSLNPDGLSRFAQWVNMHKGAVPVAMAQSREHQQRWPRGRTNHYWFDLNRDWLLAQHPESRARLVQFQAWRPNVLTDHHEMGSDSTFFFQPGVPSRKNPLTPDRNVELTAALAEFHAQALDGLGSLYYSEETFDDFYYGKGSTYPDVQGAVGILFEQASSRGHLREGASAPDGLLSFPFTIRNQVATSFSTLRGALAHREELLTYQRDFYRDAFKEGQADRRVAFAFGDAADPMRAALMAELLRRHDVEVYALSQSVQVDGETLAPGQGYVVPTAQRQYRLVRALFETYDTFEDNTFYDVSAWTLPLSHGLVFGPLGDGAGAVTGEALDTIERPSGSFEAGPEPYAYAFDWNGYFAPRALYRLLDAGFEARRADAAFTAHGVNGTVELPAGTIIVPVGPQADEADRLREVLEEASRLDQVDVVALTSGLTPEGSDLGSPSFRRVERPRVAVLVDGYTSSYEAGELWHLLDRRFAMETALLQTDTVGPRVLSKLNRLVLAAGAGNSLSDSAVDAIRTWMQGGGVVVATKGSAVWAETHLRHRSDDDDKDKKNRGGSGSSKIERLPYGQAEKDRPLQLIGGAIFEADLDLTHPLAFGYTRRSLPVFRNSAVLLEAPSNPYATVAAYADEPLLCGYASKENLDKLGGSPAVVADRMGRGALIQMVDNPSFRAFWLGTHKLFLNGVLFGDQLDNTSSFRRAHDHGHDHDHAHGHAH